MGDIDSNESWSSSSSESSISDASYNEFLETQTMSSTAIAELKPYQFEPVRNDNNTSVIIDDDDDDSQDTGNRLEDLLW